MSELKICIPEAEVVQAAQEGMDAFVGVFHKHILEAIGGELNAESMPLLNADQITLLAYMIVREEVMDGGFIQLIHNGYGPFIFLNPFAKAMRLWGLKDFSKFIYRARELYEEHHEAIEQEMTDEEFMALYEQYPDFEDLDDEFIANEEQITGMVAHYIDDHLLDIIEIVK